MRMGLFVLPALELIERALEVHARQLADEKEDTVEPETAGPGKQRGESK